MSKGNILADTKTQLTLITTLIPQQKRMSTHLGGFLMLLAKTMAFVSMFNFAMITRIQYYNADDDIIRTIFSNYWWFLFAVSIAVLIAMALIYVFVIPSEFSFSNRQSIKDNRNPLYNLLTEVSADVQELKKEITEMKEKQNET